MKYLLCAGLFAVLAGGALAQIPPGYEIIYLDSGRPNHNSARVNNLGHVVFAGRSDPYEDAYSDIFLYADGQVTQLTSDPAERPVSDSRPDINDADVVVWCRADGPRGNFQIVRDDHGVRTYLTDDSYWNENPRINNAGQIVWQQRPRSGCANSISNIRLMDAGSVRTIIADGLSNQVPQINQFGDVAWVRFNFCNSPWTSEIMLYSDGAINRLTTDQFAPASAGLSDDRSVAWFYRALPDYHNVIQVWWRGVTTTLTDWGSGLSMSGRGDIAFHRWYDSNQTWQVWLYLRGQFYQITSDPFWNFTTGINNRGEVAFISGDFPYTRVGILRRKPLGDLNCDGQVNNLDIDPFVMALVVPADYQAALPDCDPLLADTNGDGRLDALDIDPFVAILVSMR